MLGDLLCVTRCRVDWQTINAGVVTPGESLRLVAAGGLMDAKRHTGCELTYDAILQQCRYPCCLSFQYQVLRSIYNTIKSHPTELNPPEPNATQPNPTQPDILQHTTIRLQCNNMSCLTIEYSTIQLQPRHTSRPYLLPSCLSACLWFYLCV